MKIKINREAFEVLIVFLIAAAGSLAGYLEARAAWTGSANWSGSSFGWNAMAPNPVKNYNITPTNEAMGYKYADVAMNCCNNSEARFLSDGVAKEAKSGSEGSGCGLNYVKVKYGLGIKLNGAHSLSCEAGSIEGKVTSLTLVSGGAGYTVVPTVTISDGRVPTDATTMERVAAATRLSPLIWSVCLWIHDIERGICI